MAPFTNVTMCHIPYHDSPPCNRAAYAPGQPTLWAGDPIPIMLTLAQLCSNRRVPDMDAFSRLQLEEDTGKIFYAPADVPTPLLTKECQRNWLGAAIQPTPNVSPTWRRYDKAIPFMTAHATGTQEFQTLLPANIVKKGRNRCSPPNGMVVTNDVNTTGPNHSLGCMISLLVSTLLGTAAGTSTTGRTLIMYQMQIPKKQDEVNNSKIRALSDTLEIA